MAVHRAALEARSSGSPVPLQARRASREAGRLDRIQSSIRPRNGRARVVGQRRVSVAVAEGQQLPAIAARRRAALQAAASERCVVESALPLARRRRRAPGRGQPSFHPDGALAWAGPPGARSGPPGETRQVYRPGEYDCTALSVQLRHQGRLRGTRNHEDGRIDGVARQGDVLPRAAVGKCTRSGAAALNCNSRTRGRRSSCGYYSSSFTQGKWSEGGGGSATSANRLIHSAPAPWTPPTSTQRRRPRMFWLRQ